MRSACMRFVKLISMSSKPDRGRGGGRMMVDDISNI